VTALAWGVTVSLTFWFSSNERQPPVPESSGVMKPKPFWR
jgi:hypothetical protein